MSALEQIAQVNARSWQPPTDAIRTAIDEAIAHNAAGNARRYGGGAISKWLLVKHGVRVSRGTIGRYMTARAAELAAAS